MRSFRIPGFLFSYSRKRRALERFAASGLALRRMSNNGEDFSAFPQQPLMPEIRRAAASSTWEVAHHHQELEFNLIIAGKGAYFLEDRHYDLMPGTLVWLLPGQRHRLLRSPDLDMWVGSLDATHYAPALLEEVARHPIKRLAAEDAVALDQLYSHLSQDADAPDVHAAGLRYAVMSTMHAARTSAGPPPPLLHPAVAQALAMLRASDEIPNMAALAKRCGVSASYLGDLLTAQTGRGFVEWRNIARLERFQNHYPESEDLLTAALAAGFGSYTQFHRVFLETTGTTPGNWARKGNDGGPIRLPRMSHARDELSPGSQRLLWSNLGAVQFSAGGQWLAALMRGGVRAAEAGGPGAAIPSGFSNPQMLRPLLPAMAAELSLAFPDHAPRIAEVLARVDILQQYEATLGYMGADVRDMSSLAAVALAAQSLLSNWGKIPDGPEIARLIALVRQRAAQPCAAVDPAKRPEVAAGLVVQTMVLRNAWSGAGGSRNDAVATRLSDDAHAAALESLGLDLRKTPLYGPRSPLNPS